MLGFAVRRPFDLWRRNIDRNAPSRRRAEQRKASRIRRREWRNIAEMPEVAAYRPKWEKRSYRGHTSGEPVIRIETDLGISSQFGSRFSSLPRAFGTGATVIRDDLRSVFTDRHSVASFQIVRGGNRTLFRISFLLSRSYPELLCLQGL